MDLLQQFADRLDSAFDASGVDAIEGSAGALAELAASPVIPAAVATELAILERDGHRCTAIRGDTGARCDAPATDCVRQKRKRIFCAVFSRHWMPWMRSLP